MHIPDRVPARLLGRLQRVEHVSAGHWPTVSIGRGSRPSSCVRCSNLYGVNLPSGASTARTSQLQSSHDRATAKQVAISAADLRRLGRLNLRVVLH